MSTVALMSEKSGKNRHCTYTSLKVDVEVLLFVRLALADHIQKTGEHLLMQEWVSNVLNKAAAKLLDREPIVRKPPPPSKKRGPRSAD